MQQILRRNIVLCTSGDLSFLLGGITSAKEERRRGHAKPGDRFDRSIGRATKPLSASVAQAQGKLCPCAGIGLFHRKSEGHSLDRLKLVETSSLCYMLVASDPSRSL